MTQTGNGHRQIDFNDYHFMERDGTFEGRFVWRWKNPNGNLECFFDLDDGSKVRATTWADRGYLHMDTFPVGGRCRLEFRSSAAGKRSYLRRVMGQREDRLPFDPYEDSP